MKSFLLLLVLSVTSAFAQAPTPYPFSASYPTNGDTEVSATQKIAATNTYANAIAVTPSDSTDLTHVASSLWVGGAGNLSVIMAGGQTVAFTSIPAGVHLRISVTRVRATGTTATNVVALY
jgi:hypothetical protein